MQLIRHLFHYFSHISIESEIKNLDRANRFEYLNFIREIREFHEASLFLHLMFAVKETLCFNKIK